MKGAIEKCCERCRHTFTCGGYGCWCNQIPLTDRQFDQIADRYEDCLCPACLEQIAGEEISVSKIERRRRDA